MASPLTMSTPPSSSDLPGLPLELWLHIFENLGPLENLLSLISASPAAFVNFQGGKSHILRPFVDNINNQIDPDIIAPLFSSSKVRKLLHSTQGLTLSQIVNELSTFLNPLFRPDTPNPFQEWDQNLSAVIKLTKSLGKIDSAACYYKRIRENSWLSMSSSPLAGQPEAPRSEIRKFLVTLMYQTILLDLSTYRDGTLFNPRTSILDSAAWEAANPNLESTVPDLWERSSDTSETLIINDRGLVYWAVETAAVFHELKIR